MGSIVSKLDADQVIRKSYDDAAQALKVIGVGGNLVPEEYDRIDLTYVPTGNGEGEIQTVTYYLGATQIAMLTLTYNSDDKLIQVQKT